MKRLNVFLFGLLLFFVSLLFDRSISLFFTSFRNPVLDFIAVIFSYTLVQIFLFFVVPFAILLVKDRKRAVLFAIGFGFVVLFTYSLKFLIMRPRPFVVLQFLHVASLSYSFASFNASLPSSHASSSFSSIVALEKLRGFNYVWILLAVITSLSRLYEGVHYLSDLIAGALLGYFVTYLVFYLDKRYGWSRKWRMA